MDLQFAIDLGISMLITALRSLKGPAKKKEFKAAFLKVTKLIVGVYGADPDFQEVMGTAKDA